MKKIFITSALLLTFGITISTQATPILSRSIGGGGIKALISTVVDIKTVDDEASDGNKDEEFSN